MALALSLVIPAFNEASRLPPTLDRASAALLRLVDQAEIIVVDDGSTDGTAQAATGARTHGVPLRLVRLERNCGKGAAVARGVAAARHPFTAFTDADNPYDLEILAAMLASLASGRADVAIGARDLAGSEVNRGYGALRWVSGKAFSLLTYAAIGMPFRDSQCGLKAFPTGLARELFALTTVEGFGFDFELLTAALERGLRVERFPVRLTHDDDSRIRLVSDSLRMSRELWRVRRNLKRGAYRPCALATEAKPCPLCGAEDFTPRAAQSGFRMVECLRCGLWYLNPMPTRESLERIYDQSYFASAAETERGYADYAGMADDFRATFRARLELVGRHVGNGRLLDVGAGFGYLADAAAAAFHERWVVEPSPSAAERISSDHRVVLGSLESAELPQGYFDVVSMQDCLEHLPDPLAALAKIRSVLRPGGALLAVTPNVRSWLARVQREQWVSLKFPEHVVLYSEETLRRALGATGFAVERVVPAGQYARLDFLAARAAPGFPRLSAVLRRGVGRLGGASRRLYVPSGSIAVVAAAP
ncbi:MAG TPA: methyltransferase domain-containing protein [Candidatus Bathyarchaeia archaeon]|nr:methyltransferase domain-containing protein [Candidatus Bathyarchaeia archaeon]